MSSFVVTTFVIPFVCAMLGFAACFFASCSRRRAKDRKVKLLESALDAPAHGLIFFDHNGGYIMMNKETPRFLSFMGDEALRTKTINDFFAYVFDHAVDSDVGTRNAIERSPLDGKLQGGFREILQLEDGRYVLAQAQKAATGTIVTLIDITHRKKREDELIRLSRVNQDLVAAVESSASGFLISNPKLAGNPLVFANESACRTLGLPRADILGNEWKFVLDALDGLESSEPAVRAIQRAEAVGVEIRHSSADTTRWYNLRISPVRDHKGNLDLFIGVLTDTTELRMRESEFFQSQKLEALGQLAGGIAHDFNNVLSIIDGYTRLTAGQIDKAHPSQNNLERVKIAVERGAALTRQLLMFGRRKIVLDTVQDLTRIVREQQIMLTPLLDGKVDLDIETAPEPLFVECAADEIGQIVMNLTINARDAMPQGGKVSIRCEACAPQNLPASILSTERHKKFARLSVIDTGTGMDAATVKKIFDPFFTTKNAGKGTGLGLSVVHGMVKNMGGVIDVVSTPGEGTTMSVYLPLTDKTPTDARKIVALDSGDFRFEGYTVLIAEDEPDLLALLGDMLERLGLKVLRARDGNEALLVQDAHEEPIDLLITDVVMPEVNGVKLAEMFLSLRPDTKVIFMSGYPATGQLAPVELPKDSFFMAKPVSHENLLLMLKGLLGGDKEALQRAEDSSRHWH